MILDDGNDAAVRARQPLLRTLTSTVNYNSDNSLNVDTYQVVPPGSTTPITNRVIWLTPI
jgi:hypothetical protein